MKQIKHTFCRRTVLGSIVSTAAVGLAGCSSLGSSNGTGSDSTDRQDVFQRVYIDGTDLTVELDRDAVDQLNVIDPTGELFAQRSIESGVSRVGIDVGTTYEIGTYEIIGVSSGESIEETSIVLEPELELTELKLGLNHPDAMHEEASDSDKESEAILQITNSGTGPTAVDRLRFDGGVPFPTPEQYEDSGIYNLGDGFRRDAESVVIPPKQSVTIYSTTRPFLSVNLQTKCNQTDQRELFTVHVSSTHKIDNQQYAYTIHYFQEGNGSCNAEIEEEN